MPCLFLSWCTDSDHIAGGPATGLPDRRLLQARSRMWFAEAIVAVRAIARQAEAERERRAKVIHAEGEQQASEKLLAAANVMSENPAALQLRYLQTMSDMAQKNASTVVLPFPFDLMEAFKGMIKK